MRVLIAGDISGGSGEVENKPFAMTFIDKTLKTH
jgi:hypothetical protein